ncbi:CrcB protein [Desulfofarcimen acetoxidans DSM 771]|uniref:Fluoride-specific ion channel FluC n=1 Tax=Desulfofarcimen acetoxidans (strain ATCC 49208 / DSM 771 / KCTC 5769 / VKM B-1644 / 5575) TaxID=485916 RepID=C8W1M8_DESAS|nr:CrcB protein [Desulfofarcimen acetoxidans DSM 771]
MYVNDALLVGIGGFLGANSRYLLSKIINKYWKKSYPIATFLINILGSFLLGLVVMHPVASKILQADLKYGIGIGFMGAFTTFSTFEFEVLQLVENKKIFIASLYIVLSFLIGFILAWFASQNI